MENFGKQSSVRPRSRTIHTANVKRRKFHFRWWMALILITSIAIIGLVVLRFSYASGWDDEKQMVLIGVIVDSSNLTAIKVTYPPYNYSRTFNFVLDGGQEGITAKVEKDLQAIYNKNHPSPPPTPTPTPATPTPATPANPSASTATPTTTSKPSQDSSQTTASTTTDSATSQSDNNESTNSNSALSADSDSTVVAKDLGILSGYVKIDFTPQDPDTVTAIAVFVEKTNVGEDIKAPYKFGFDTSRFKNGEYKISTVVLHKDNTKTQQNYTAKIQNSSADRFLYSLGFLWRFVFGQ